MQVPFAYGRIIDQELSKLHIVSGRNTSSVKVVVEQFTDKLRPEVTVERTAVRNEGTSLGDITNKTRLE